MKNLTSLLTLVALVTVAGTLLVTSQLGTADAAKSSGTKNQPYGKNAPTQICGDKLCVLSPSMAADTQPMTSDTANLESILRQMDAISKKHQAQLKEKWATLGADEKAQFGAKLRDMLKKMESMNIVEHMNKMMKDDMSGKEGHGEMKGDHKKNRSEIKGDHKEK